MIQLDPVTLVTLGLLRFCDRFGSWYLMSAAHPAIVPKTGEIFNVVEPQGRIGTLHVYLLQSNPPTRKRLCSIPIPHPVYFHCFALTLDYVIVIEQPLRLKLFQLIFSLLDNTLFCETFHRVPK